MSQAYKNLLAARARHARVENSGKTCYFRRRGSWWLTAELGGFAYDRELPAESLRECVPRVPSWRMDVPDGPSSDFEGCVS